jgi:hypothetical protein
MACSGIFIEKLSIIVGTVVKRGAHSTPWGCAAFLLLISYF